MEKKIFNNLNDLYNKLKEEFDSRDNFKLWTSTNGSKGYSVNVKFIKKNSSSNDCNGGIYLDNNVHLPWIAIESTWLKIATTIKCPKQNDNLWWEYKKNS